MSGLLCFAWAGFSCICQVPYTSEEGLGKGRDEGPFELAERSIRMIHAHDSLLLFLAYFLKLKCRRSTSRSASSVLGVQAG